MLTTAGRLLAPLSLAAYNSPVTHPDLRSACLSRVIATALTGRATARTFAFVEGAHEYLDAVRAGHAVRTPTKEKLVGLAGEACPSDPRVIYAYYFETCAGSMKPMRTDWEAMCSCSTGKVVEAYLANPIQNTRHIAALQRDALKACGFGDRSRSVGQ